jgi:hypothetical protein
VAHLDIGDGIGIWMLYGWKFKGRMEGIDAVWETRRCNKWRYVKEG